MLTLPKPHCVLGSLNSSFHEQQLFISLENDLDYSNPESRQIGALWAYILPILKIICPISFLMAVASNISTGDLKTVFANGVFENIAIFNGTMGLSLTAFFAGLLLVIPSSWSFLFNLSRKITQYFAVVAISFFAGLAGVVLSVSIAQIFVDVKGAVALFVLGQMLCIGVIAIAHKTGCILFDQPPEFSKLVQFKGLIGVLISVIGVSLGYATIMENLTELLP